MGYVVGAIAGFILAYIAGEVLLHSFQAGLFPGVALALWIGTAISHDAKEEKLNLLFPIPLKYELPVKQAFAKVKKVIKEFSYDYGTTFRIHPTNPSQDRKIFADMTWTDVDEVAEPTQHDFGKTRKTPVKRHIRLEIYFRSVDQNSTVVEIRWYPRAEGLNSRACEPILRRVNEEIEAALGEATTDLPPKQPWIPPVWLHIATIACVGLYILAAAQNFQNQWKDRTSIDEKNQKQIERWKREKATLDKNKEEWKSFKKTFRPPPAIRKRPVFSKPGPPPGLQNSFPLNKGLDPNKSLFKKNWTIPKGNYNKKTDLKDFIGGGK